MFRIVLKQYEYEVYFHKQTWFFNNPFKYVNNQMQFACFTIKRQDLVKLEKHSLAMVNAEKYGLSIK